MTSPLASYAVQSGWQSEEPSVTAQGERAMAWEHRGPQFSPFWFPSLPRPLLVVSLPMGIAKSDRQSGVYGPLSPQAHLILWPQYSQTWSSPILSGRPQWPCRPLLFVLKWGRQERPDTREILALLLVTAGWPAASLVQADNPQAW